MRLWDQLFKPRLYQRKRAIDVIKVLSNNFLLHGVAEPIHSAKYLVGYVIYGKPVLNNFILMKRYLNFKQTKLLRKLYRKRLARVPIQYLIGQWYFYKDDILLKMQHPVFIPRPETEDLVDLALKVIHTYLENNQFRHHKFRMLEIGCGSGAISLAILKSLSNKQKNKSISCVAIDANIKAVELTKRNALSLGVELLTLHEAVTVAGIETLNFSQFDLIVSNPPYLCTSEVGQLQDEVKRYEDHCSLVGGKDGLDIIYHILHYAQHSLNPGGKLLLEVSLSHPQTISAILEDGQYYPLHLEAIHQDFTKRDRFIEIIKQEL